MVDDKQQVFDEAIKLLRHIANIKKADSSRKATFAAQGQAMDGYTMLYNYNCVAEKIVDFLKEVKMDG